MNRVLPSVRFKLALEIGPYWEAVAAGLNLTAVDIKKLTAAENKDNEGYAKRLIQYISDSVAGTQRSVFDVQAVLEHLGRTDAARILIPTAPEILGYVSLPLRTYRCAHTHTLTSPLKQS